MLYSRSVPKVLFRVSAGLMSPGVHHGDVRGGILHWRKYLAAPNAEGTYFRLTGGDVVLERNADVALCDMVHATGVNHQKAPFDELPLFHEEMTAREELR